MSEGGGGVGGGIAAHQAAHGMWWREEAPDPVTQWLCWHLTGIRSISCQRCTSEWAGWADRERHRDRQPTARPETSQELTLAAAKKLPLGFIHPFIQGK